MRTTDEPQLRQENEPPGSELWREEAPHFSWRTAPFPTPWDEVFNFSGPLVLEVGFGDGRHTVDLARAEPCTRFVGVEVSVGSTRRALSRVGRAGVHNVRLAKLPADLALRQLFAPDSLDAVIVNFPCPWPKKRHAHHRLLNRAFFTLAAARLKVHGEVRLATDDPDYLAFAKLEGAASGYFVARESTPPRVVLNTKYALKWREQGKRVYYATFSRTAVAAPLVTPWEREEKMPHSLLAGRLNDVGPFEKLVTEYGDGHVIVHELATSLGGEGETGRLLARVTVQEPTLRQQLLVIVQQRAPQEVIVRLENFGEPLITKTVRGAVHAVTEWLLTRTDLELKAREY